MKNFRATAFNREGLTFSFTFLADGWGAGMAKYARDKLDVLIEADEMHKRYGPWDFCNIDVSA